MTRLVLAGAGHAHVEVLRRFGKRPMPGVHLTLLTRQRLTPYSGMIPALVAGHYRVGQAYLDAANLAAFARAEMHLDEAVGIDLAARTVLCRGRDPLPYDLLSLDIGSCPNTAGVPGAGRHALPVKPIDGFLPRFESLRRDVIAGRASHIVLVGGGAGGVELLLAVEWRLRRDAPGRPLRFTLLSRSSEILPDFPPAFRKRLRGTLAQRGIDVQCGACVTSIEAGRVLIEGRIPLQCDAVLWTTEAAAAPWLAETGLLVDAGGFVRVDASLRAATREDVFAAGDVASFSDARVARSGVYAVRAGPVLDRCLRATVRGTRLPRYRPQHHALTILGTADGSAVLTRNGLVAQGAWAWRLKDWIDRRFVDRFDHTRAN